MSFRRDKEGAMERKRWLARCRPRLVDCGLPSEAYETQRAWWFFLDHGNLGPGPRTGWFGLDALSPAQLQKLHEFLEAEYGDRAYPPHVLMVASGEINRLPPESRTP